MSSKAPLQKTNKILPLKEKQPDILFEKDNFMWMLIGIAIIFFGFYMMSGGGSDDPAVFSNELFSTKRVIIAPIIVIAGFIVEVYAILKKTKEE